MFHEGTCLQNKKRQTIYSRNIAICHVKDRSKFFQPKKPIFFRARFARNKNHYIQPIFRLFQSHFRAFLTKKSLFFFGLASLATKIIIYSLFLDYFRAILGLFQPKKPIFSSGSLRSQQKSLYIAYFQTILGSFQGFFGQKTLFFSGSLRSQKWPYFKHYLLFVF